ncbi:LysR family transcriptional regulator [Candidatus Reidiella endopervernicosa]|uniref:LysR family transcriptional regulator n=2 Tax=Gammaproteobacteria incertae sedis TaxID=118884 RepID=A0A6N0HX58_9GAMM|nr:LysR family transcriptional regulator [Candidatus Reidiella endopervernicosa]QKQ26942.1 LysR family transcriptional regulator [Candidatus Reidiella endopervernicosa]
MIHATLQQLRLFEAVARHKSFTRAAEEIHLSQPAVSIQVKRLEENVGKALFEHVGRRITLTEVGRELYDASKDVLGRLAELDGAIDSLSGEVAGTLTVTAVTSAKYFLPHLLGAFLRRYPDVEPKLKVANRASLLERVGDNEDDLYVMGHVPDDLDVEAVPFLENVIAVVASPNHPLASKRKITLKQLTEERFLVRESGSGNRKVVEEFFEDQGLSINPYMELGSAEAIKQGVMAGLGISALSLHNLRLEIAAGQIKVLKVEGFPLRRRWNVIHRKEKNLSPAAQSFIEFLQTEGQHLVNEAMQVKI